MSETPTFNHTRGDGPENPCPECATLMVETHFFGVIHTLPSGRMALCHEAHPTLELAEACAKTLKEPVSIIEWKKDRTPQFKEVRRLLKEKK